MARPSVLGPARFVGIHCPVAILRRLDKLAQDRNVTRSTVIRRACAYYLDEQESWDADDDADKSDA